MANAIEFNHVSKQYRLGLVSTKTLSHDIRRFWITNVLGKEDPYLKIGETNDRATKGSSEYVWALRDIDFSVEQGDVVGIIGKNGAGKSTLLKLLSRVTGPTTGQIRAHGRIGSLLEVGTGFHSEMTGRENIYMNGAILGMTKSEIDRKLDEIVDFSGCERYIDTPVKRYSSGMMVRLGFAVAAHLEPEILVVDEVLAVGDAEFQKKAIGKMQDVAGNGRTVLFVSHNMDSILNLCHSGIVLEKGMVNFMGTSQESVNIYTMRYSNSKGYLCPNQKQNRPLFIQSVDCIDANGMPLDVNVYKFDSNSFFRVIANWDGHQSLKGVVLDVSIYTQRNVLLCSMEYNLNAEMFKDGTMGIVVTMPKNLIAPGGYFVEVAIHQPNVHIFDLVNEACSFTIQDTNTQYLKYNGVNQGVIIIKPIWECQN